MQIIHRILGAALLSACALSGANAQSGPVLIELYTSQGCSSCPPADALLSELAKRDDVLPLSLHVDYWDYIGWKDEFASPANTARQKSYAKAAGRKMVYTPQMIIAGDEHVVGNKTMKVMSAIERAKKMPATIEILVVKDGDYMSVEVRPLDGPAGKASVQLVRYEPSARVSITRGENTGRAITYTNIVTHWQVLTEWNGRAPLRLKVPVSTQPGAIVVQRADYETVLAAARLR